jgi:guanine deaminase
VNLTSFTDVSQPDEDIGICSIILAEEFQSAGIRGFVGKLSMDTSSRRSYTEVSASASLDAAAAFINKCNSLTEKLPAHSRLVEPVITPRFVPTCSNELLKGLGQLAEKKNVRVQSHMAEARDLVNWVQTEHGIDDVQIFKQVSVMRTGVMNVRQLSNSEPIVEFVDWENSPSTLHLSP